MEVYTIEEVAQKLKLTTETLRRYLREGKLSGAKIGRHWRITDKQLEDFLQENTPKK